MMFWVGGAVGMGSGRALESVFKAERSANRLVFINIGMKWFQEITYSKRVLDEKTSPSARVSQRTCSVRASKSSTCKVMMREYIVLLR